MVGLRITAPNEQTINQNIPIVMELPRSPRTLSCGTSDTIRLAVSPDGHEVEIASTFTGFLKDSKGRPIVQLGQTIDIAAGMECDSKAYPGKTNWAADNTIAIRGYQLNPGKHSTDSKQPASE